MGDDEDDGLLSHGDLRGLRVTVATGSCLSLVVDELIPKYFWKRVAPFFTSPSGCSAINALVPACVDLLVAGWSIRFFTRVLVAVWASRANSFSYSKSDCVAVLRRTWLTTGAPLFSALANVHVCIYCRFANTGVHWTPFSFLLDLRLYFQCRQYFAKSLEKYWYFSLW